MATEECGCITYSTREETPGYITWRVSKACGKHYRYALYPYRVLKDDNRDLVDEFGVPEMIDLDVL